MGATMSREDYERHVQCLQTVGDMSRLSRPHCLEEARLALVCLKQGREEAVCLEAFRRCFGGVAGLATKQFLRETNLPAEALADMDAHMDALQRGALEAPGRRMEAALFACGTELEALRQCSDPTCWKDRVTRLQLCEASQ